MDFSSIAESWNWLLLVQILGVNIVLSGDNAVLIALAAAGLPAEQRGKAIMFGMVLAVVLRIVLSLLAVQLLAIPGLLLVGGLVLLWIAYSFFKELRQEDKADAEGQHAPHEVKSMATALRQIVIADVSMSLDNVLAVAGAARGQHADADRRPGHLHPADGCRSDADLQAARAVSLDRLCGRRADRLDRPEDGL